LRLRDRDAGLGGFPFLWLTRTPQGLRVSLGLGRGDATGAGRRWLTSAR